MTNNCDNCSWTDAATAFIKPTNCEFCNKIRKKLKQFLLFAIAFGVSYYIARNF